MNNNVSCAVIRDLLPSYADGLTSGETNKIVQEHLDGCPACTQALRRMKEPEASSAKQPPEVDYLKKIRRRTNRASLFIGIALMLLGMALLSYRFFYVGSKAAPSDVACAISVSGDTVSLRGTLTSSALAVSRVTFWDSNGMVQATVYTAPKTFFNSGDFSAEYTAGCDIGQVRIGELILWENGISISPTTAQLFAAANPFVGDMPSNANIASLLGIDGQLGFYTSELQTETEPYGWTLILETAITEEEADTARNIMTADSYVMLAVIDNLGYVTWQYNTEAGPREYTVTAQEASASIGQNIKSCAQSVSQLQTLMQSLSIKWAGMKELPQADGSFSTDNGSN